MARVEFTQFLRPDARKQTIGIERSEEIAGLADALRADGCRFEAECFEGLVQFEVMTPDGDDADGSLAMLLVKNGPKVPAAVDKLVRRAAEEWKSRKAGNKPTPLCERCEFEPATEGDYCAGCYQHLGEAQDERAAEET